MTTETKQIDTSGAAFPVHGMDAHTGMTRRQWLAAQADLSAYNFGNDISAAEEFIGEKMPTQTMELFKWSMKIQGKLAYMWADAMLAAERGGSK